MSDPSVIPPSGRALEVAEREALLNDLKEIVESSHLFKSLDDEGRKRLIRSGYVLSFKPGQALMSQGERGTIMYLIMSGQVTVETSSATGTVQLAELSRGACVGEVSVLTDSPRTATVTASSPVNAVAFEKHRIMRVVNDYPEVRKILQTMIEGRARDAAEKIIQGS